MKAFAASQPHNHLGLNHSCRRRAVMRRLLLISLSLVLALVGWSSVGAEDGFYVIPAMRGNYAPVPKTGQTTSYGTRDDGDLEKGVAWPSPRFTDNLNGTVTDKLTGLIWLKNGNYFGEKTWVEALQVANELQSNIVLGLTDGSKAGDWRLPNVNELQSLLDHRKFNPALPEGHPFIGVASVYWSSTTRPNETSQAYGVNFYSGIPEFNLKSGNNPVWCVRGGP
jgi:hypothetical protein